MAQRKSAPSRKTAARTPGGRSTAAREGRPAAAGASSAGDPATKRPPAKKAPARSKGPQIGGRKKPKSIVNQKQTPWGLIITTTVVVLFAAAVVVAVVATHKSSSDATASKGGQAVDTSDPYRQPEDPTAAKIQGVTYTVEGNHTHVEGHIKYDMTPPVGGDHSQYWADCTGTVYAKPIANENAVHMLEHGAVWITYNANDIKGAQLAKLKSYVSGIDRMAMSPYPNLSTPISLQAWGYQLKLSSASDPRIAKFIAALKYNQKTTPEYGATCSQPTFIQHPSTFGHPLWEPAGGASGNTGGM